MLIVLLVVTILGSLWLLLLVAILRANIRRWRRGQRDFTTGISPDLPPISLPESFYDPGTSPSGGDGGGAGPGGGGAGGL